MNLLRVHFQELGVATRDSGSPGLIRIWQKLGLWGLFSGNVLTRLRLNFTNLWLSSSRNAKAFPLLPVLLSAVNPKQTVWMWHMTWSTAQNGANDFTFKRTHVRLPAYWIETLLPQHRLYLTTWKLQSQPNAYPDTHVKYPKSSCLTFKTKTSLNKHLQLQRLRLLLVLKVKLVHLTTLDCTRHLIACLCDARSLQCLCLHDLLPMCNLRACRSI